MLSVAARHPLEEWAGGLDGDEIYREGAGQWQLQGVRPANHPRRRLRQYQDWVARQPDWPDRLCYLMPKPVPGLGVATPTTQFRKQGGLAAWRELVATQVLSHAMGGTRLDTLLCDGLLPLIAARTGTDLLPVWFHWHLGDVPREVRRALRETGIAGPGAPPLCHGWGQGLLGWMLDRDASASG
jgi:hypothetical protein